MQSTYNNMERLRKVNQENIKDEIKEIGSSRIFPFQLVLQLNCMLWVWWVSSCRGDNQCALVSYYKGIKTNKPQMEEAGDSD